MLILEVDTGVATILEAFRHNPAHVASYQCPLEQVLDQRCVPEVPPVLHRNAITIFKHTSRVKLTCLTTV
jgi:hypothetical protein